MPLEPPQRDENGRVILHNHEGILSEDWAIRRIPINWVVFDPKINGNRISSYAFKPSSGVKSGLSVDLQRQIEDAGLDAREYVTNPRWVGSLSINVGQIRVNGFMIGYDPLPDNPYHGEVWGEFSKANQKKLRDISNWFVPIEGVVIA